MRCLIFLSSIIISCCITGCASYRQIHYDSSLASAKESLLHKEYYSAVNSACDALRFQVDEKGKDAKEIIINNMNKAIRQQNEIINKMPSNSKSFQGVSIIENNIIASTKCAVYGTPLLNSDIDIKEFNASVAKYKARFAEEVILSVTKLISSKESTNALNAITSYMDARLPANEKTDELVQNLIALFVEKGEADGLIEFAKLNSKYFNEKSTLQLCAGLYKDAERAERSNDYKKAIANYENVLSLNENSSVAKNSINRLTNEITTIFTVAETNNSSEESMVVSNIKILSLFKEGLEDKNKYIEVSSVKNLLIEENSFVVDFDNIMHAKDLQFKTDRKVRYIILPKITSLKINRSAPIITLKTANWDSSRDGNALFIGAGEYGVYGGGTISYYEYTEGCERVAAFQRLEFAIYDTSLKKVILKDRIETKVDDSVTWADNPMAVGVRNKVPATVYPSKIKDLISNQHSAESDDDIKSDLMKKAVERIVLQIKDKLLL